jgi:uncharacterized protein (UPF0335 family)
MTIGHNSKRVKAGPVNADRLKSFVERVEKLEEEKKAISDDVRDVYAEAKGVGYDVKTIRWVVQERKADAVDRDERDALRDTYAHALGMAVAMVRVEGLSLRQAEEATGVSKSSIQRALAVPELSREMTLEDLGDPLWVVDRDRARFREEVRAISAAVRAPDPEAAISDLVVQEWDWTIPDFLRRTA